MHLQFVLNVPVLYREWIGKMVNPDFVFPTQPFFSCEANTFSVLDKANIRQNLLKGDITPLIEFRVGLNNIFEQPPEKVVRHQEHFVTVQCRDGTFIWLDFESGIAQKHNEDGVFRYMGSLEEGNVGKGFIKT
jgi:hypothetical protein